MSGCCLMFNLSIYFAAVVSDDGGVRTKITLQSPACFVSYKSWLSVHGTCNEGKPGEILSNLCGQFSGDITTTTTHWTMYHCRYTTDTIWKQLNTEKGGQCWTSSLYLFVYRWKIRDNELMGILVRSH